MVLPKQSYRSRIPALLLLASIATSSTQAQPVPGDFDNDGDRDLFDFSALANCIALGGPAADIPPGCEPADFDSNAHVDLLDFSILQRNFAPWPRIVETSPANGEGMVALTRETIITVANPLDPATVTSENVFAAFGGAQLTALLRVTPDGIRVKLFYDQPLPPSARVRVTVDGSTIRDIFGNQLDADGDGAPGGIKTFDFDTCTVRAHS